MDSLPILRNWEINKFKENDYVVGEVYNDSRFTDRTLIRTSLIKSISADGTLKTMNTIYLLDGFETINE